jgi:N-acetylmuramoyl-L-alanine amidase
MKRFLIILDPGHGIETPGKRSPVWEDGRQLFEHEFNLDITQRVRKEIKEIAFVVQTREDEHDVSLKNRVQSANGFTHTMLAHSKGPWDKILFVSIHANAGGGKGWEVFTSVGETESDKYATVFYEEMMKEFPNIRFRKDMADGDPDKESQFYVLRKTSMPAVLTENFFMDTLSDCEIIMSEEGRQKIANAHIEAIRRIVKIWKNEN